MGIDPGKSGAISIISMDGKIYESFKLEEMTDKDIMNTINELAPCVEKAYLEKVNAIPGTTSAKGTWTFAGSYFTLKAGLLTAKIPFDQVSPKAWQDKMMCRTGGDKNISKAKAQELFPNIKIIHANADSLLIGEYGRREEIRLTLISIFEIILLSSI